MLILNLPEIVRSFRQGAIVEAAHDLMGVQAPDGALVPPEKLGPGLVEQTDAEGHVRVRWIDAGFDSWLDAVDLSPLGSNARLVTLKRRDKHGNSRLVHHRVVKDIGLQHNWIVEMLPKQVVRALRPDGSSWTFTCNGLFRRLDVWWSQPPRDDDAEAYTVAEIALFGQP